MQERARLVFGKLESSGANLEFFEENVAAPSGRRLLEEGPMELLTCLCGEIGDVAEGVIDPFDIAALNEDLDKLRLANLVDGGGEDSSVAPSRDSCGRVRRAMPEGQLDAPLFVGHGKNSSSSRRRIRGEEKEVDRRACEGRSGGQPRL